MTHLQIRREGSDQYGDRYRWVNFTEKNGKIKICASLDLTSNESVEIILSQKEKEELLLFLYDIYDIKTFRKLKIKKLLNR